MKTTKRKISRAFTLIETLIVLGIMALVSIGVMLQLQRNAEKTKAKNAGEKIKELGNALQKYVSNNKNELLAAIPAGNTKTLDICILTNSAGCAPNGVPVEEILPQTFTNNSLLQTGYKIALKNVDNKSIDGLVYTDGPVIVGDTEPRYDLLGIATKEAGNAVGFSNDTGTKISGLNGGWSIDNADLSYGGEAGILAYRLNGIDNYDGSYLRRDGSNGMTGDLLLGNNNIKNVNGITADNYMVSQNAYFQNVRTQSIYNSGDIYTNSLNASAVYAGVVNTNVINADNPNKDTVFGTNDKNTANGNLYAGNMTAKSTVKGAYINTATNGISMSGSTVNTHGNNWALIARDANGADNAVKASANGSLYINDIYLRSLGKWASQSMGGTCLNKPSRPWEVGSQGEIDYTSSYLCSYMYQCLNGSWVQKSGGCEQSCCFPLNSLVLIADGTLKAIQDIIVGDMVMGIEGRPTRVKKTLKPILGDRRVYAFKDGTHIWSEEHGHWVRNKLTRKEWPWSANVARWISEMEEEMGAVGDFSKKYQGGLKDIYGMSNCPMEDIEFAGLDGFAGKEVYEIEGLDYNTPLFSPSTEDGQAIIVNGYVVGGNWNEYATDYHQISWDKGRQKILSDLGIDTGWLMSEVRKSLDKTKAGFKYEPIKMAA